MQIIEEWQQQLWIRCSGMSSLGQYHYPEVKMKKPALPESAWAIPAEGLSMPMALGNKPSGQEPKEGQITLDSVGVGSRLYFLLIQWATSEVFQAVSDSEINVHINQACRSLWKLDGRRQHASREMTQEAMGEDLVSDGDNFKQVWGCRKNILCFCMLGLSDQVLLKLGN